MAPADEDPLGAGDALPVLPPSPAPSTGSSFDVDALFGSPAPASPAPAAASPAPAAKKSSLFGDDDAGSPFMDPFAKPATPSAASKKTPLFEDDDTPSFF